MKEQYDLVEMFSDCFMFRFFERADYDRIRDLLVWQQIPAGKFFFHQGDAYNGFFLICAGEVEIFLESQPPRTEQTLSSLGKGEIFGEIALFMPDGKRSATARAKTDVDCCFFPCEFFNDLLDQNDASANKIVLAMATTLSERLDRLTKKSLTLNSANAGENECVTHNQRDLLKFQQQLATSWSF